MGKLLLSLLTFFIILCLHSPSYAQSQHASIISKMEKSLFGMEYLSQPDSKRIERIEEMVYGNKSSGDVKKRLDKLSSDISADMLGQEIKPKGDTFAEEEDSIRPAPVKADSNVNYPIIDALEKSLFKNTHKNLSVEERLANLEKKSFSKIYNNDDLSSRTERLKATILPNTNLAKVLDEESSNDKYDSVDFSDLYNSAGKSLDKNDYLADSSSAMMDTHSDSQFSSESNPDINIMAPLTQLEKKILRRTYKNEEVPTRLVRLEVKLFNSTFTEDDVQARMDRLASAYQASKSSKKYDNNKFSQKMATAMQIGAFLLMIIAVIL